MKLILLFRRRWALFYLPVLAFCALAIWLCATFLMPLPPTSFVMAGGLPRGGYTSVALRYRDLLEQRGIRVEVTTTEGALGPMKRLADPQSDVQAGFSQGLLYDPKYEGIVALAAIERQPTWVFTRVPGITDISQLKGKRIAAAAGGNPAENMTKMLLTNAHLPTDSAIVQVKSSEAAANELFNGRVDAAVIVAIANSESVRQLIRSPGIQIISVSNASAVLARESRLKVSILPQGAIELRGDIPPTDVTMVGSDLHLLVRSTMHPALQRALLDAAHELHELPGFLQRQGEFPNVRDVDFPLSPVARALDAGERPMMERLLPYRWAQLAELLLYAALPILIFTFVLLTWIPNFFAWKVNAVLQNYYGELKFLESEIVPAATTKTMEMKKLMQRLDNIEQQVAALDLPNQYANRWYTLREHCASAREKLLGMRAR